MSNEREGLRAAIAEIVADHCIDYQGCSGKHEHASLQIADEILALLTQAQEPVGYVVVNAALVGQERVSLPYPGTLYRSRDLAQKNADLRNEQEKAFNGTATYTVEPVGASPVPSAPGSDNVRKTTDPDTFLTFPPSAPELPAYVLDTQRRMRERGLCGAIVEGVGMSRVCVRKRPCVEHTVSRASAPEEEREETCACLEGPVTEVVWHPKRPDGTEARCPICAAEMRHLGYMSRPLRATPTEEQEREDQYRSDRQDMADAEYGGER